MPFRKVDDGVASAVAAKGRRAAALNFDGLTQLPYKNRDRPGKAVSTLPPKR